MLFSAGVVLALGSSAGIAQMSSRNNKVDVLRVGSHLACQCGCKDTVASCSMPECGFSVPARARIMKMQSEGVSDQTIIDTFVKENGPGIYRGSPNAFGWLVPYAGLALGVLFIWWVLKRMYKPKPVVAPAGVPAGDPRLARYNEQIEKELEDLE